MNFLFRKLCEGYERTKLFFYSCNAGDERLCGYVGDVGLCGYVRDVGLCGYVGDVGLCGCVEDLTVLAVLIRRRSRVTSFCKSADLVSDVLRWEFIFHKETAGLVYHPFLLDRGTT